ncbi:polysaccharide deacetylase family protein [Candidatus Woesearchaeota archaeon]|nr:hypothetical protein [uncultured archaeon]MBS3124374.1 polysaccharide deacetylase family protein [Candidatus Woesearchaeota archaeon]
MKRSFWKKLAASIFGLILIVTGVYSFSKKKRNYGKYITGLFFHDPSRNLFERCLKNLRKNKCNFISSEQVIEILQGKIELPSRAVWITLDDGWKGNITEVIPVIKQYKVPITIFVSTGPVESRLPFWFSTARRFEEKLPIKYRGKALWKASEEDRKRVIKELEENITEKRDPEAMSISEIKDIASLSLVTIGNHTMSHVIMNHCTFEEMRSEIKQSQAKIKKWTGKEANCFAYPNGNFNQKVVGFMKESGFILAVTTKKDFISLNSNIYELSRFCVNDEAYFPETICQLTGAWGMAMDWIKNI